MIDIQPMNEGLIERYEAWLKRPFEPTVYYPNEGDWRKEVTDKINQLKNIK